MPRRHAVGIRPVTVGFATSATPATAQAIAGGRLVLASGRDRGSRARDVVALQRLAGNRAVTATLERVADGSAVGLGTCGTPELTCTAKAEREHTKNISVGIPAKKRDRAGNTVYKATGTVTARFKTNVVIDLATVPDGLSDCAAKKVAAMIETKLKPHEEAHKARFLTTRPQHAYVGTFTKQLSETSDDPATAQSTVKDNLDLALDEEVTNRIDRNDRYAIDAIDPFHVTTDISDCPECQPEE